MGLEPTLKTTLEKIQLFDEVALLVRSHPDALNAVSY